MDVFRIKQKFFDVNADSWWGDHLDVRFQLLRELKRVKGKRVLAVGCNNGVLLSELENSVDAYGFDINVCYVKNAKNVASNSAVCVASMHKLPYKPDTFDIIIWANNVPGADFPEPKNERKTLRTRAMWETYQVLKPGGRLFLTTPNQARYRSNKLQRTDIEDLVAEYRKKDIRGWNPLPNYPHFIPSRMLARVPGMFNLLEKLMYNLVLIERSKYFFVRATK